jgi:hypothetical protein
MKIAGTKAYHSFLNGLRSRSIVQADVVDDFAATVEDGSEIAAAQKARWAKAKVAN